MKEDFSDLVEYLDERFNAVDERFNTVDERFNAVDERFSTIEAVLAQKTDKKDLEDKADKDDVRQLVNAIDAFAHRMETYFQEFMMLVHKVNRLEKWIKEASDKIGIKYDG